MLRVGIFGTGHLGKFHLNNWKEIEGTTIAGFYDPNDATAEEIVQQYGIRRYATEDELMDACDLIDVVSPTPYHFATCAAAIRKGRHVFVEKPMANTMEEGAQLVKLVQESKVKLQVGHVERFNPAFVALDRSRLNPMFIEIHRLAQFNPRGTEVSVILDLMIHDIDIVLSMVQSDVKLLSASGVAVLTDTPDIANVRIEFNNGCVANLTSSRISLKKMRKMRLFQKDAYISVDFLDKKTEVIRLSDGATTDGMSFPIEVPGGGTRNISIQNPAVQEGNAIRAELEAFVQAIRNNTRTVVNEIDGFRAMEVAHQILQKIHANLSTS
ncbi:MAG: Gfo/Idh/MocA family oxidoreductase [Chitinophagaceae bacterium]|nr:MAG: Gfo/Idh/MocA family oxidoreductase [Chitinophagaceae bacterium]